MGTKFYKAQRNVSFRSVSTNLLKTLTVFFFILSTVQSAFSQTGLSFTQIPGDFPAPGKGAQNWGLHPWNDITQPSIPAGNKTAKNYYTRFNWRDIESSTVQGSYTWGVFDNFVNQAIDAGAMFSFGVMPLCDGCGAGGAIPQYVVNLMSAEGKPGPVLGGVVYPNYQSTNWSKRYSALLRACANHIATTSRNGKSYSSAFYGFDLRHAGNFGEFADLYTNSQYGSGAQVTDAYLNAMVDTAIAIYPDVQLTVPMGYFTQNGNLYGNASGAPGQSSAYKILTASNKYGRIGWRRDNIGDDGYNIYFTGNSGSYNPGSGNVSFQPLIMDMWKYAPIGGEPSTSQSGVSRCGSIYCDLHNENMLFHMSYFGNGNAPGGVSNASGATWTQLQNNWRAASAEQGYRLVLTGGSMTSTLSGGGPFNVTVNWQNIGIAPVYEKWNVTYELRKSDGSVVWTGNSAFTPRLFLPQSSATPVSDNFTLSAVAAGTYSLYMIIRDPLNYKQPLPLSIAGRGSEGSYLIRSNITVGAGGPVNQAPTVNAGGDKTIQLPTTTVSLAGTAADADGFIASYAWTKVSGPAAGAIATPGAAATSITGLVQGVYVYTLTVKDEKGATASDNVQITVDAAPAANLPPVVSAGSDKSVQLPTNSVSVAATASDPDGTVASYSWAKMSGPAGGSLSAPTAATTNITGLAQGVYTYQLTVTDNKGMSATDNLSVTVNAAPVANTAPVASAGADKTIQLPTNTVSLTGSGVDLDGTISSYNWAKSSGPAAGNISTPGTANASVTGLVQGTYQFTLTVTDDDGASASDVVQVIVNAAVNTPPVARAGNDINITLPANSVSINGSASSDADGSITAFAWTKISGPTQFTLGNNTSASTIVSNLTAGVYSFQLKVTDNGGAIALDTVKIIVNAAPVNQPPVANAGADISIALPTNVANISGSASSDADGIVTNYSWSQVSGPNTAGIGSAGSTNSAVSGLIQGIYVFSLRVTDNNGATDLDSVRITVNQAANVLPVANAGSSKSITLPVNNTSLNGTASSDPDGTITGYSWNQLSGPSASSITSANQAVADAGNMVAGVYTFELTVTDNRGGTAKSSVKITVIPAAVQLPVANAGADQTITLPTNSVTISGSGSTAPSGSIVSYVWTEKSGPTTVSLTNAVQNTITNLQAGTYIFFLTVTDNNAETARDSVIITVQPAANKAPVADAGSSINLILPVNNTVLDGSKSYDSDGTINKYSWTWISGPNNPSVTNAGSAKASVGNLIVGVYTYQITVTDNDGASSSAQVKVRVAAAVNVPPVANAGANLSITSPASSISLNGSASSDPDGTIVSYSWSTVSGPGSISINNSNTATPSAVGLQTGSYIFELTVTDNRGASAKDQVTVTVLPKVIQPNQSPVANAGTHNWTITLPVNSVILDGTNSFDPDGTITVYSWKNTSGPSVAVMSGTNTVSPTASQLIVGTYVFELTVTDNNGAKNIDYVNVIVNKAAPKANQMPVADAGDNNLSVNLPSNSITLDGSHSYDPDGNIVAYSWKNSSGPTFASISKANTAAPIVSQLVEGTYVFELTVTDNDGATNKDFINVIVYPAADGENNNNLPPVAYAGTDDSLQMPTNTYTLNASKSKDPDGTIVSYQWKQLSGPNTAYASTMNGVQVGLGSLEAGIYEFEVTVMDNDGATSKATMKLRVEHSNNYLQNAAEKLTMYPNPAHSVINSKILSPISGSVKISIYDMNGRLVYEAQDEKTSETLTKQMYIDKLPSGMYTVIVNIANRKTLTSKFIKN